MVLGGRSRNKNTVFFSREDYRGSGHVKISKEELAARIDVCK